MTDHPPRESANRISAADKGERRRCIEQTNAPSLAELLLDIPQDGREFERLNCPPGLRMSFADGEAADD